jgi:hypothetical protein
VLPSAKHCTIYEEKLSRVWPDDGNQRQAQIAQFTENHGFRLRFYRDGLCAIFVKEPRRQRGITFQYAFNHTGRAQSSSHRNAGAFLAVGAV